MVSIVLGALLLVTAGLKAHGLYTDPYSQESILLSPRLLVAVIEIELLLGLWLLSGYAARAAWLAGLAFFALLTAGSLYLAVEGQRSCGCFGRVEVSPWWTFGLDLAAVAALVIWRPRLSTSSAAGSMPYFLKTTIGAIVLVALIGGAFLAVTDDPAAALARLRGEALTVDPPVTDVGEGAVGEQRAFTVNLINHSDRSVRIVGGTTTCQCITTSDLPTTVGPQEAQTITLGIRFTGSPGRFQHRFLLFVGSEEEGALQTVRARFGGRVKAGRESP